MISEKFRGVWKIDSSTSPLISSGDTVAIWPAGTEAVIRVRRSNVTVILGVGVERDFDVFLPLPFGQLTFSIDGAELVWVATTNEGGQSPEGGGTSVGPPKNP